MKPAKVKISPELPITLNLILSGQPVTIQTDNVLSSLRELEIDPLKIKTRPIIEITYGNETYRKAFTIPMFKRLLVNSVLQQIVAKQLSVAVGLKIK